MHVITNDWPVYRYENARQQIDTIFGQKFHPNFPRQLKSCDQSGCGQYPSTSGGVYNEGIDVIATSTDLPLPLSGYMQLLNSSNLPVTNQDAYASSNYSNSIVLIPDEPSYEGVYVIISNLIPAPGIGQELQFFTAGDTVAMVTAGFIHIEIIKANDGVGYRLDPTSYLQPRLEPNVEVELECNDLAVEMGGVVVERVNIIEPSNFVSQELLGEPLVVGKLLTLLEDNHDYTLNRSAAHL